MLKQAGAGQRPGELGEGDHQVSDGDVGAQLPGRLARSMSRLDGRLEPLAGRSQVGVVLVEGAGEHRAQGADPLVGRGVHEAAQRVEARRRLLGERPLGLRRTCGP